MGSSHLAVKVLGPFEAAVDGARIAVPAGRLRALLAGLALSAGRSVDLDTLATRVWGEALPVSPRASLHTYVVRLRNLLGAGAILTDSGGYQLDTAPERVDALHFLRQLDGAAASEGEHAYRLLTEALELWRGAPLADVGSATLEEENTPALTERFLAAVERHVDLELALGRVPGAERVALLRELTGRHPLRESLWARLLEVLRVLGRQAEALEAYGSVRTRLAEELGTAPSAGLRALYADLLRADETVPDRGVRGDRPAGSARSARQAGQAENASPGAATGSAGARQARGFCPLPPAVHGFMGRSSELTALDALLGDQCAEPTAAPGRRALAVVHGTGGVGKTSLVVTWAHGARHRFPDGVLCLDLHGYGPLAPMTAHHALGILLAAIGVPMDEMPASTEERTALWRGTLADRRVLLILDNAHDAEQVRPLLPGEGGTVVVTSRSRLLGLSIRDGATSVLLNQMTGEEAARLLTAGISPERAAGEPEAVARLVRACGGLPLALRIVAEAASRHPVSALADVAAEFGGGTDGSGGGLDALAVTDDPATDPRTVFSWSYERLDAETARMFRLLSVVPGTEVTAAAAAALTDGTMAAGRALLRNLADLHLLEEDTPGRFRAHDLLREYALERARSEETGAERERALGRLLAWYLGATDAAAGVLHPGWAALAPPPAPTSVPVPDLDGADGARAWLDAECANLVAAIVRAAEPRPATGSPDGGTRPYAWLLANRLRGYFWNSKRAHEWRVSAEAALAAAEAEGDTAARAAGLENLAALEAHSNHHRAAVGFYERSVEQAERAERLDLVGTALNGLAGAYWRDGRLEESAACLIRALDAGRLTGRRHTQYAGLTNLAKVLFRLGRTEEARDRLTESLQFVGSSMDEAGVLVSLTLICHTSGLLDEARSNAERALPIVRAFGAAGREVECLLYLGLVARDLGQEEAALSSCRAGEQLARTIGDSMLQSLALGIGGDVHQGFGHDGTAEDLYRGSLAIAQDKELLHLESSARSGLARVAIGRRRLKEAVDQATRAVDLARTHGFADREGTALRALAEARLAGGEFEEAVGVAREAARVHESAGQRIELARALLVQGRALAAKGDRRDCVPLLKHAHAILVEAGCADAAEAAEALDAATGTGADRLGR